jgi:hypothetical protein
MPRGRSTTTLDDRIRQAKEKADKAKTRYDTAIEELNVLINRKRELQNKELIDAIAKSDRSYDEIMNFLNHTFNDEDS